MPLILEQDLDEIYQSLDRSIPKMLGKQILITGAAGFLGRYFMSLFHTINLRHTENPIKIVALDNYITSGSNSDELWQKTSPDIEWIFGDANIAAQLPNKFDYIIHAAGIASPQHYRANPLETVDVAVKVTRNLLEKAKSDKSRMLFFSSSEIYGDPFPEFVPTNEEYRGNVSTRGPRACYDESKRMGETLCWIYENYFDVHVSIARPFNIYGPGMMPKDYRVLPNFAAAIAKDKKLELYGHGKQTRTFCYITDAINAFLKILIEGEKPNVYNVGNPNPEISMIDLAEKICKLIAYETGYQLINYPSSYPEDEPNRRCPDISRIQTELNYTPTVSLEIGLLRFLNWSKSNYTKDLLD
jgi:UDP-glucuronate decarboxylase